MDNPSTNPYLREPNPAGPPGSTASPGGSGGDAGQPDAAAAAKESVKRVREEASRLKEEARHRTKSLISDQKHTAAEQVGSVAGALRQTAQQLNAQGQASMARYVDWAAEGLDDLSGTLRDKDVDSLVRQAEDFARRQPAVVIGGAVAIGFLLSRFLKSSAERSESEYDTESTEDATTGYAASPAATGGVDSASIGTETVRTGGSHASDY